MTSPVAGKFLLEILTKGMYSNPMHIYREYIQNSSDAIDYAVNAGILEKENAEIHIIVDKNKRIISIKDNGSGIPLQYAKKVLMDVGASDKDGIEERGFRGIGRLGGLAYAERVTFTTSVKGENKKTVMSCDCVKMTELLKKTNKETTSIMDTFQAITSFETEEEDKEKHYFEVVMYGVQVDSGLLEEQDVFSYLEETAPVDFNSQKFAQANEIRDHFKALGHEIPCYKIFRGSRAIPVYKKYSRNLSTGKQARTKSNDYIKRVEFIEGKAKDGQLLYIGWLAITDFSGKISDDSLSGIRLRKGNILVGDNTTFDSIFPSEGAVANRMFVGEVHVFHKDLIPNSQRDDFERNSVYTELLENLSVWAGSINRKYRRGTSVATSSLRKLNSLNTEQEELQRKISSGVITSDDKREQLAEELEKISKEREKEVKKVNKAVAEGVIDSERLGTVNKILVKAEKAYKTATELNKKIAESDYATKNDLPSSYGRKERTLYQQIIKIIDNFFKEDPDVAEELRNVIKNKLSGTSK